MRRPGSAARGIAARLRRPSPAMCVALIALFLSAGGASYAAISIPAHSVGAAQLRTFAVTNAKLGTNAVGSRKIMPGAVGFYRVNRDEVQLRVTGTCTGANQAITSVSVTGTTTCGTSSSSPAESDSGAGQATALSPTAATVASYSAAGGSAYLVQADPSISVTAPSSGSIDGDHVTVTCKLVAGTAPTAVSTQSVTVDVDSSGDPESTSLPLTVIAPTSAASEAIALSCSATSTAGTSTTGSATTSTATTSTATATPVVDATSTIYAVAVSPAAAATAAAVRR